MICLADSVDLIAQELSPETFLSPHFTVRELACSCCGRIFVSPVLLEMLEQLRKELNCPIHLDPPSGMGSGYRCPSHNKAIKGASRSKHCLGLAVDIPLPAEYRKDIEGFQTAVEKIALSVRGGMHYYAKNRFAHMDCWPYPAHRRW